MKNVSFRNAPASRNKELIPEEKAGRLALAVPLFFKKFFEEEDGAEGRS